MIINTFISDNEKIPEYTLLSLQRLRDLNPDERILFVCSIIEPYTSFFARNRIEHVQQRFVDSELLAEFNELSLLKRHGKPNTKYPSSNYFFHRAMERIYYLEAVISNNNLRDVWHFENDVLTYYPLPSEDCLQVTKMGENLSTFAAVYIPHERDLNFLCSDFNFLLSKGEAWIFDNHRIDMVNEMTLLGILNTNSFPILPTAPEPELLYDPGSYGQFLGGTNNDHGPGYAGDHHYIGKSINKKEILPFFREGKPFVRRLSDNIEFPLFNLHIHSKNLKDFL